MFCGERLLAETKALLESSLAQFAGYQRAPTSRLMVMLADACNIVAKHGIRFGNSSSEASDAAKLAASANLPLRGAVTLVTKCVFPMTSCSTSLRFAAKTQWIAVMAGVQRTGAAIAQVTLGDLRDAALVEKYGDKLGATLARHALA